MEVDKKFLEKQDIIIRLEGRKWEGNLDNYKVGGVWALFGKKSVEDDTWLCLQVAKARSIAAEIRADIKCLVPQIDKERSRHYVNQFGKEMFYYDDSPSCRELLYNKIVKEYENLVFICVYKGDDIKKRTDIEKYFAWNAYPLYWRDGGPYKNSKKYSEFELDEIKEKVINKMNLDVNIRKTIDSFFEYPQIIKE